MPTTKAQQRAVSKYMKENYDEIKVRVEKGQKEIIKAHAEARGESVNGFLNRAVSETMERDKAAPETAGKATEGGPSLHVLEQRVRRTLYKYNMLIRKKGGTYTVVGGDEPHTFNSFGALLAFADSLD